MIKFYLFFLFLFCNNLYAQFNLEWQFDHIGKSMRYSYMDNDLAVEFVEIDDNVPLFKVFDGQTHNLEYTFSRQGSEQFQGAWVDFDNDGVNEVVLNNYSASGNTTRIVNAVTDTEIFSSQGYISIIEDVDADQFLEIIVFQTDHTLVYGTNVASAIDFKTEKNLKTHKLYPNYPNPFNPVTTISYEFPNEAKSGILTIFDILGNQIKRYVLINQKGKVVWNGTNSLGKSVSNGVYFYKLETDSGFSEVKKMTLLK